MMTQQARTTIRNDKDCFMEQEQQGPPPPPPSPPLDDDDDNDDDETVATLSIRQWYDDPAYGPLLDLRETTTTTSTSTSTSTSSSTGSSQQQQYRVPTTRNDDNNNNNNNNKKQMVAIPLSEVRARSFELPARTTPFCLWVDHDNDNTTSTATTALERFTHVMTLSRQQQQQQQPHKRQRRQIPWNIQGIIFNTPENVAQANALGFEWIPTKNHHRDNDLEATTTPQSSSLSLAFVVQPRLWSPDPLVEHVLLPFIWKRHHQDNHTYKNAFTPTTATATTITTIPAQPPTPQQDPPRSCSHHHRRRRRRLLIWDLGAGAGRDACFLAEELLRLTTTTTTTTQETLTIRNADDSYYKVLAMDQRYRTVKAQRLPSCQQQQQDHDPCQAFFQRRGLTTAHADCQCIDLKNVNALLEQIPSSSSSSPPPPQQQQQDKNNSSSNDKEHDCLAGILLVRYWNKALVQALIDHASISPGTWVAISHFGLPTADYTWTFDHPKPSGVLQYKEVNDMFLGPTNAQTKWKLVHEQTVQDGDRGRPLLQYIFVRE